MGWPFPLVYVQTSTVMGLPVRDRLIAPDPPPRTSGSRGGKKDHGLVL